jgi:hypothetical protein
MGFSCWQKISSSHVCSSAHTIKLMCYIHVFSATQNKELSLYIYKGKNHQDCGAPIQPPLMSLARYQSPVLMAGSDVFKTIHKQLKTDVILQGIDTSCLLLHPLLETFKSQASVQQLTITSTCIFCSFSNWKANLCKPFFLLVNSTCYNWKN